MHKINIRDTEEEKICSGLYVLSGRYSFPIKDPGRNRNPIKFSEIDCVDLVSVGQQYYEKLKSTLTDSQERTSKLLKFLDQNEPSLS